MLLIPPDKTGMHKNLLYVKMQTTESVLDGITIILHI